jgi:hypothetical protein
MHEEDEDLSIKSKPEVLADLVLNITAAVSGVAPEEVREAARVAMKYEWYGPWGRYGSLMMVAAAWFEDISSGISDPDVPGDRSREELIEAFTTAMDNPVESTLLGGLLAAECGQEAATLGTFFRAGQLLGELMLIDPYLSVVRPGLVTYHNRMQEGQYPVGAREGSLPEEQSVVADIHRLLTTLLEIEKQSTP